MLISAATTLASNTVQVVNFSSDCHAKLALSSVVSFSDMNLISARVWTCYGHSKLSNVLHTKELARRYGVQGIIAVWLHPGTVKTGPASGPRESSWWYKYIQPLVELGAPGREKGGVEYALVRCESSVEG